MTAQKQPAAAAEAAPGADGVHHVAYHPENDLSVPTSAPQTGPESLASPAAPPPTNRLLKNPQILLVFVGGTGDYVGNYPPRDLTTNDILRGVVTRDDIKALEKSPLYAKPVVEEPGDDKADKE